MKVGWGSFLGSFDELGVVACFDDGILVFWCLGWSGRWLGLGLRCLCFEKKIHHKNTKNGKG